MLRVWRLFPPRYSIGAHSNTATDAPDSRAVSAAHSAALPPPTIATSVSMICSPTLFNRISFPSLAKEGWLRLHKEGDHFFDRASTPPWPGRGKQHGAKTKYGTAKIPQRRNAGWCCGDRAAHSPGGCGRTATVRRFRGRRGHDDRYLRFRL